MRNGRTHRDSFASAEGAKPKGSMPAARHGHVGRASSGGGTARGVEGARN